LIYTLANAKRLAHIERNPHVALNFNSDGTGGDIIVFAGVARLAPDMPPADQHPAYAEKYRGLIAEEFQTAENFARGYPIALRITPTKVRGF
jgi:PPOX class probable F420-dependent enzyme